MRLKVFASRSPAAPRGVLLPPALPRCCSLDHWMLPPGQAKPPDLRGAGSELVRGPPRPPRRGVPERSSAHRRASSGTGARAEGVGGSVYYQYVRGRFGGGGGGGGGGRGGVGWYPRSHPEKDPGPRLTRRFPVEMSNFLKPTSFSEPFLKPGSKSRFQKRSPSAEVLGPGFMEPGPKTGAGTRFHETGSQNRRRDPPSFGTRSHGTGSQTGAGT